MSYDFSSTSGSNPNTGIPLIGPSSRNPSSTLIRPDLFWKPVATKHSLNDYSFSRLEDSKDPEELHSLSNSVYELVLSKPGSPFSDDTTDVEEKTPPLPEKSSPHTPHTSTNGNEAVKDFALQEHNPKKEPKIFGKFVPIEGSPNYSFDELVLPKKAALKIDIPFDKTAKSLGKTAHSLDKTSKVEKNIPIDKEEIARDLGLTKYSAKVQQKIVDCYLSEKDSLNLSGCELTDIPPCLSTDFPWLSKLNLSNNHLKVCDLEHDTLIYLNLANNKLETFEGILPGLETLNLFNNRLEHFRPYSSDLLYLHDLNIAKNSLVDFPEDLPSLEHLHCQGNKLTKMANPAIRFPLLNYLNIDHIELSSLTTHKLREFSSFLLIVDQLQLENYSFAVQLKIIDCYLTKNADLDLSGCELNDIPLCLSTDFPWLSKLNLSNNQLTNCSLEHKGLSELLLENNQLRTFEAKIPNIIILNIARNQLERFRIDPKQFTKLLHLDLSNNQLIKFSLNLLGLIYLSLQNNKLKALDIEFPSAEASGGSVDLSGSIDFSELIVLPPEHEHIKLKWLDLSGNEFEKLDAKLQLPELAYLSIDRNKLTEFPKNIPSLQQLSCKNNQIAQVSARASHFPKLTFLDITENKLLKPLDIKFPKLDPDNLHSDFTDFLLEVKKLGLSNYSFDVQQKIITCLQTKSTSLNLSGCNLKIIPPCIASHLSHITHLNLSHNNFKGVFKITAKLLHLESLDLSFNKITAFNKDLTSKGYIYNLPPPNLKRLNLSHNEFEIFTSPPGNLDKLEDLDISDNKLIRFSASKEQYPELKDLDLSFNPNLSEDLINFYDGLEIIPVLLQRDNPKEIEK